jgi:hypothetical protein
MNAQQELFLVQARTVFSVFSIFRTDGSLPHCHALHYLQMATELLGKAHAWGKGPQKKLTHRALVKFLKVLASNTKAQSQLNYKGKNEQWTQMLRKWKALAERIEDLAPDLAGDDPNPEYPWPPANPTETPARYEFPIWKELTDTADGRAFLKFFSALLDSAESYL